MKCGESLQLRTHRSRHHAMLSEVEVGRLCFYDREGAPLETLLGDIVTRPTVYRWMEGYGIRRGGVGAGRVLGWPTQAERARLPA